MNERMLSLSDFVHFRRDWIKGLLEQYLESIEREPDDVFSPLDSLELGNVSLLDTLDGIHGFFEIILNVWVILLKLIFDVLNVFA